ncbi:MAG: hypothetical protein P1U39_04715 [Legionellaceae bacterium]|nr:hypothetical protein [Legionellaceae bacterium]
MRKTEEASKSEMLKGNFNASYANLIFDNKQLIEHLAKRGELYLLGKEDAYFAERLLVDYPYLLDLNETNALQEVVELTAKDSCYSDEMHRMQHTKKVPERQVSSFTAITSNIKERLAGLKPREADEESSPSNKKGA